MAKSKSKTGRKVLILVIVLLVIGGLTTAAILKKREPIINVQTEKIAKRNLTEVVVANGRVQPFLQVKISPEVSGEIIELPVKEGQKVKKGDLLVKIKPDQYVANLKQSKASYQSSRSSILSAESNLRKAESEFGRYETLFNTKMISESLYQEAKTAFEIAKAQVESSKHQLEMSQAALDRAQEDLGKTTIMSPLDGTVSRLNSQLGERVVGTAMMAGTEIMIVADLNDMEARVDIGEIDVVLIALGQHARLEVDAFKDRKFNGVVTEIANSSRGASAGSGGQSQEATKFEVRIRIQEKEAFRPGMSVTAEIETRSKTNVISVPIASVTTRLPKPEKDEKGAKKGKEAGTNKTDVATAQSTNVSGTTNLSQAGAASTNTVGGKKGAEGPKPMEVVFLKEGDRAKMVQVKRGISDDSYVEITEGLTEGQEVVSGGYKAISRELEDGKKIVIGAAKADVGAEKEKK